jgi:hypothetical protein
MCIPCCFTVSTAEVALIERWGKFHRLAQVRKRQRETCLERVRTQALGGARAKRQYISL